MGLNQGSVLFTKSNCPFLHSSPWFLRLAAETLFCWRNGIFNCDVFHAHSYNRKWNTAHLSKQKPFAGPMSNNSEIACCKSHYACSSLFHSTVRCNGHRDTSVSVSQAGWIMSSVSLTGWRQQSFKSAISSWAGRSRCVHHQSDSLNLWRVMACPGTTVSRCLMNLS